MYIELVAVAQSYGAAGLTAIRSTSNAQSSDFFYGKVRDPKPFFLLVKSIEKVKEIRGKTPRF